MKFKYTLLVLFVILVDPLTGKYLGNYNSNSYDSNSVANPYGRYGSPYSSDSINNPYGKYGSPFSGDSVNNPFITGPGTMPNLLDSPILGE